ncbi:MAG: hypothetical protein ACRC31_06140 [Cetobacterium sp.]
MILIPFSNLTKQEVSTFIDNKNVKLILLNINDSFYLNIETEIGIVINGMRLSNLYPLKVNGFNGAFFFDREGGIIGTSAFVYYLESNEIPII